MTVYFGIWHQSFGLLSEISYSSAGAVFNTLFFTMFWVLMVWSHFVAVKTQAGYLPEGKQMLCEELIPSGSAFYQIIAEREDIYHEHVVQRKLKEGQIGKDQLSTVQDESSEPQLSTKQTLSQLVKLEKRKSANFSLSIRRNTAIDRVLERSCFQCDTM